jgi:hypothetical protein
MGSDPKIETIIGLHVLKGHDVKRGAWISCDALMKATTYRACKNCKPDHAHRAVYCGKCGLLYREHEHLNNLKHLMYYSLLRAQQDRYNGTKHEEGPGEKEA